MLSYQEALAKVLDSVPEPRTIRVPLAVSQGHVLAETVYSDLDLPPFDKSFMDGYALRARDVRSVPRRLRLVGTMLAGTSQTFSVGSGQAVQIMTGAPVPAGADAVQMVEKTQRVDQDTIEILELVAPGDHIAPQASEVKSGSVVLEPGRVVGPAEIAVLATFGQIEVTVFAAPRVVILATGDEIVELDQKPAFGQIRNSNAHMLLAQCLTLPVEANVFPVVADDPQAVRQALDRALVYDVVIFSGGVSMGEHDFVHRVLAQSGVKISFHKARIKPGKPILVGRHNDRMIFGLPGNPVSSFVTFELFVRAALRQWLGFQRKSLVQIRARLVKDVRQKPGRTFFKPARVVWRGQDFWVEPIQTRGSADIVAFSRANGLLVIPADVTLQSKGSLVDVLLLSNWAEREDRSEQLIDSAVSLSRRPSG